MLTLRRSTFHALFLVLLLVTEFFYIEIGEGVARIYHFMAVLVVLALAGSIHRLLRSGVFVGLLAFAGINVVAAGFSDRPLAAFASLMSFFANVAVAMAVALILVRKRISPERLTRIVGVVTVISVLWSLLQILAVKAGVVLALSPEQEPQILIGFGPGFRTEANTFGKYMVFPFLLLLPAYLRAPGNDRLGLIFGVMIVGMLINFTRSALLGLLVAFVFVLIRYMGKGRLLQVSRRGIKILAGATIGIGLLLSGAVQLSDYGKFKIENFFNKQEILEGGSSSYRLMAMEAVIDSIASDSKRLIIGSGWGQTYLEVQEQEVQAGGADVVNILGFGGLFAVCLYLAYSWRAFNALRRLAGSKADLKMALFAEGLLFAFVGMFVTGQMSGYLIAPEYWLLIGTCIYCDLAGKGGMRAVAAP